MTVAFADTAAGAADCALLIFSASVVGGFCPAAWSEFAYTSAPTTNRNAVKHPATTFLIRWPPDGLRARF
jgi:hypothetical protein